jgi:hypothetical protein
MHQYGLVIADSSQQGSNMNPMRARQGRESTLQGGARKGQVGTGSAGAQTVERAASGARMQRQPRQLRRVPACTCHSSCACGVICVTVTRESDALGVRLGCGVPLFHVPMLRCSGARCVRTHLFT